MFPTELCLGGAVPTTVYTTVPTTDDRAQSEDLWLLFVHGLAGYSYAANFAAIATEIQATPGLQAIFIDLPSARSGTFTWSVEADVAYAATVWRAAVRAGYRMGGLVGHSKGSLAVLSGAARHNVLFPGCALVMALCPRWELLTVQDSNTTVFNEVAAHGAAWLTMTRRGGEILVTKKMLDEWTMYKPEEVAQDVKTAVDNGLVLAIGACALDTIVSPDQVRVWWEAVPSARRLTLADVDHGIGRGTPAATTAAKTIVREIQEMVQVAKLPEVGKRDESTIQENQEGRSIIGAPAAIGVATTNESLASPADTK